jgi:hypothetical protein
LFHPRSAEIAGEILNLIEAPEKLLNSSGASGLQALFVTARMCARVILREELNVRGLNTAAPLWLSAAGVLTGWVDE